MAKKTFAPKKRGRPATGRDPAIAGRAPQPIIDAVNAYADREGITRSAAVAMLLEAGLKAKGRGRKPTKGASV